MSVECANFWSLLNDLVWIFGKSLYLTTSSIFFSNSRSLEGPGLKIETLEYITYCQVLELNHRRQFDEKNINYDEIHIHLLKFRYCEKATQFEKRKHLFLE